ncbi:hypothetical protein [Ruegeria halocynthiae]|uniref:hypothetical protein n=1 Tax=Ruegeria halocynthiae TaxID=985054 RepID=UPI00055E34D5|nr:hypothetical protein [Ruegeria halocynthiae]
MKVIWLAALLAVSACTAKPLTMSVPSKAGHDLNSARKAVHFCTGQSDEGGNSAVIGGYMTNIVLFGILPGTVGTMLVQDELRTQGEYDQVDRCLTERGFERRELTPNESAWLRNTTEAERARRLDHLVDGGKIEAYGLTRVQ